MQTLLMRSKYRDPNALTKAHTSITAQKHKTVCHVFATKSSLKMLMALKISCAPEKLMLSVTVQLPTRVSHPSTKLTRGAHSRELSMADQ
jgi:hypothetical protein